MKNEILEQFREKGPMSERDLIEIFGREKKSVGKDLSELKKQGRIERLALDPGKGGAIYKYYFPYQFLDAVTMCGVVPIGRIDEYLKYQNEKEKGTRSADWLKMAFVSLKNNGLSKMDRLEFVKGIGYYCKDPTLSYESKTYQLLSNFFDEFLSKTANHMETWDPSIMSRMLFIFKDFTHKHLLNIDSQNKMPFFHEKIEIFSPNDEKQYLIRYRLVKRIYNEYRNDEVKKGAFGILNEIYFNHYRNLEYSYLEELKTLIEDVFFSANSKEDLVLIIEKGWDRWFEKEEKYKFWKKVNEQLRKEKNDRLKKRFHHFIMKEVDKPSSKTESKAGKQKTRTNIF